MYANLATRSPASWFSPLFSCTCMQFRVAQVHLNGNTRRKITPSCKLINWSTDCYTSPHGGHNHDIVDLSATIMYYLIAKMFKCVDIFNTIYSTKNQLCFNILIHFGIFTVSMMKIFIILTIHKCHIINEQTYLCIITTFNKHFSKFFGMTL